MASRISSLLILALITLAASLPGVFTLPVLDRDEARFAQATAQMLELQGGETPACLTDEQASRLPISAKFIAICFQDQQRNKKPVGVHWAQAISVSMFSTPEAREIWAYRLPSVLGAILAVWGAYLAGCSLLGRRAAFAGAAMLGGVVLLGVEAGIAKTDALLAGATTLAMAALARLYVTQRFVDESGEVRRAPLVRWIGLGFWVALAAGVLLKGPITPMVVGLTIITLFVLDRRLSWLGPLGWWPGPLAFVALTIPWFAMVTIITDGAFIADAFGKDFGAKVVATQENHGGAIGFHALLLPLLFFPATLLVIPAIGRAIGSLINRYPHMDGAGLRFLLAWAVPAWIVFELAPTKLWHYPLPAYPALALLAGATLVAICDRRVGGLTWIGALLSWGLYTIVALLLAGMLLALPIVVTPEGLALLEQSHGVGSVLGTVFDSVRTSFGQMSFISRFAAMVALLVFIVGPLIFMMLRWQNAVLATALGASMVWQFIALQSVAPRLDQAFVSRAVAEELLGHSLHPSLSPTAKPPVATAGYGEPSLVFLTHGQLAIGTPQDAALVAAQEAGRAALVETRLADEFLSALSSLGAVAIPVGCVEGLNYSKGDRVQLEIFRITREANSGLPPSTEILQSWCTSAAPASTPP